MRGLYRFAGAFAAFVSCAAPGAAADDRPCNVIRVASLDMSTDEAGGLEVPMSVGGRTVNLLIDTGGVDSMLSESVVANLKLPVMGIFDVRVIMFGGIPITKRTYAHDVDFGGLKAPRMYFLVAPNSVLPEGADGFLAPDVMRAYDDEFDFGNARFNLFLQKHCKANLAYWTKEDHSEIPFALDGAGHMRFVIALDGRNIRADLDTGASRSFLNLEEAEDLFGFNEGDPRLETLEKTSTGHVYRYPFKTLSFGGVSVTNPDLMLVSRRDERMPGGPTMLLGMGILRQLHMYIAYGEKTLYVTAASAH
jgi:predicted aspartyl protease